MRNDSMDDETDRLAARAKAGDRQALNALLEGHLATVYRFVSVSMGANHPDLEDIVQETLIGAVGSIRALRGETNAQVAGWLISIARHKVADHLRASYSHPKDSLGGALGDKVASRERPVDDQVMELDRAERLRELLHLLTPEQEEILVLRFVLGFGISEVAEITHRPAGAVKSMQHRALASLSQKMGPELVAWT
ncbi:MAG: RNA polymerase sigma factor [Candidatus Dormibacteraceae bacterium]